MLAKKSSIITKAIIGISIIALFIMPISVSAYEQMSLTDWGWGQYSNGYFTRTNDPNDMGTGSNCWAYYALDLNTGYTYTITDTVTIRGNYINSISSTLYYDYKLGEIGVSTKIKYSTDKALLTFELLDGNTHTYRIKLTFNTDTLGIPATNTYFFVLLSKVATSVKAQNEIITCYYDPGGSGYQQEIVDTIAGMKNQDTEFYSNALEVLDNIKGGVDSANTKLDGMPQKIEDVLDKQANEEKTEANSKGNDVVNQATEALQNVIPYTSLLDAIQPIKQAASYTGTVSVWTLPSITIPKITGVMEETEIMSEKSFDLVSYADQLIPDTLLSVIRAVNTIGLILFAVYEVIRLVLWVVSSDSEGGGLFK